jgi:hypothetical protein
LSLEKRCVSICFFSLVALKPGKEVVALGTRVRPHRLNKGKQKGELLMLGLLFGVLPSAQLTILLEKKVG